MLDKLISLESKFEELTEQLNDPNVVTDVSRYAKLAKQHRDLSVVVEKFREFRSLKEGLAETRALLDESSDPEMLELAREELLSLTNRISTCEEELKILLLPKDPNDEKNVILEIRAGTGGNEASLFASELMRMYTRFGERHNWKVQILSTSESEIGGFKECIAMIEGDKVYSKLKFESGVHRVQRVPQTEASGRIHTSTVTVAVLPEAEEVDIQINPKDLRVDTYCSSGPGGQSVNTTYSAVRITHLPTNTVVAIQDEKSQIKNREKAMRVLRARLLEVEMEKQQSAISSERRSQVGSGERSEKIRTYNFKENRVSDHRIGLTIHSLNLFMDGDLEEIIQALITHYQTEKLKEEAEAA
ncbi:MAG: peptide chain release factor 1 [Blastocatellia bacterium]|nr:peptide chain release factor 1 [Blastocatellia bacterium]